MGGAGCGWCKSCKSGGTLRECTRWLGCLTSPCASGSCCLHHSSPLLASSRRHLNGCFFFSGCGEDDLAAEESPLSLSNSSASCSRIESLGLPTMISSNSFDMHCLSGFILRHFDPKTAIEELFVVLADDRGVIERKLIWTCRSNRHNIPRVPCLLFKQFELP